MLFLARNQELINDREKTYLTSPVAVAGTTLTVKAVDANAWADNDYIIVGEIGTKTAELLQINGAVSDGTSLTIDQSGAGGARYVHAVDEPVYRIDYNQIEISRATTITGAKTVLAAADEIQPDDLFTRYEDSANTTGFGFVRWRNGADYSEYSDPIPYSGYTARSLGRMIKMIRRHLDEPDFRTLRDEDIIEEINEKQRDIAHERLWPFYEDVFSLSSVANTRQYDIDDDVVVGKSHTVTVRGDPMAKINRKRWNMLHWDTARTGDPTHIHVWNNDFYFYPTFSDAAATDTLDGAITATSTIILLDDTTGFDPSGRIIIGSEIISYDNMGANDNLDGAITAAAVTITVNSTTGFPSAGTITIDSEDITYTGTTATTFTGCTRGASAAVHADNAGVSAATLNGCKRGLEESTAAIHNDAAAVTARDIIYTANREPNELADIMDETLIPDPLALVYGVAMELALGKLGNQGMHDRMKIKYDQAMDRLRDKFGRKQTSSYYAIKDKDDFVRDVGVFRNPQDYPTDINL